MSLLHDAWEGLSDGAKHLLDAVSIGLVFGTIVKMLPAVAAFLSIVWTLLRIWESKTVERVRIGWRLRRSYRKVLKEPVPDDLTDTLKNLK